MSGSTYNVNEMYAKELEDELMKYTRMDEQNKSEVRLVEKFKQIEKRTEEALQICPDADVNIIECTKSVRFDPLPVHYQDTTESSSSFADSDFGDLNDVAESEALSMFHDDATTQNFDSFHEKFSLSKKKLTEHWRSYIQPIIWRCKWLELQIKNLDSKCEIYEKELQSYKKRRTTISDSNFTAGSKAVPFPQINCRNDVLKRKRRRRVEETSVLTDYMSRHKLFAYYENKKLPADGASKRNETKNPGKTSQIVDVGIEFGLEDALLCTPREDPDNSSEHVLWKIFSVQAHVNKLKSKAGKIVSQNSGIVACLDDLSFSMPNSASTPETGDVKEHTDEFMMPENSISNHGDTPHDAMDRTGHACSVVIKEEIDDFRNNHAAAGSQAEDTEKRRSSLVSKVHSLVKLPANSRKKRDRRKAPNRKNR